MYFSKLSYNHSSDILKYNCIHTCIDNIIGKHVEL